MAKIDHIFKTETRKAENHPKRITKWIHYSKLHDHKDQYCNERNKEEIEALADLIEADGEVLQDLLVRKIDTDEYEIIAGHKRRRACRLLVEERGKDQFALLPCYVKEVSDIQSEFRLYSSNGYHDKTEYEKMHELERMKYLLENYPEEFPQIKGGRMVERLARILNMKKSTVGEYLTIAKNLGEKGMEKFKSGELKKSAAVALSSFPEQEQEKLIDQGVLTHAAINKTKSCVKEGRSDHKERIEHEQSENPEMSKSTIHDERMNTSEIALGNLKNNEQRKEWLENYKAWGIWYTDEHIDCTYYKYDFQCGARLIAEVYVIPKTNYMPEQERCYLHLVGGPEPQIDKSGIKKWGRHEKYCRHPNSITELIEFLKFIQNH